MEDRKDELNKLKEEYKIIKVPKEGLVRIENAVRMAQRKKHKNMLWSIGIGIAAAVLTLVILPNTSSDIALAMEKVPVLGRIVRVVTFNRYEKQTDHYDAKVDTPAILLSDTIHNSSAQLKNSINKLNQNIKDYTDILVKQFERDMKQYKNGHQSLDVSYKVVTDSEDIFSLQISITQSMASTDVHYIYYHIDKHTGQIITLKDLFKDNAAYVTVISKEIQRQMAEQVKSDDSKYYYTDPETEEDAVFNQIKENQNFYYDDANNLVIVFDKYEVAPGYMGCPEFTIPQETISSLLKGL